MSASWGSDPSSGWKAVARAAVWLLACVWLVLPPLAEAELHRHWEAADSARQVERISVSDRGIEIEHGGKRVLSTRSGRADGKVVIGDWKFDFDTDSGSRDHRRTHVRVPGVVVDTDEPGLVRVFADADVPAGERVEGDVVAVFGSVHVGGHVAGNVVAVFGAVRLEPGAVVEGDAVAIGGMLDHPHGATVNGESVSLGFLPIAWGVPTLRALLGTVLVGWILSLFAGWVLTLIMPDRLLRIAATASQRTGWSLLLGLCSAPFLVIMIGLLVITVILIPLAFVLPILYFGALWTGQIATSYVLGSRILRRRVGQGSPLAPIAAGTLFVAMFFFVGALMSGPAGSFRTIALFLALLGALLIMGLSTIGVGAVFLSGLGVRPRGLSFEEASPGTVGTAPLSGAPPPPPAAATPPGAPGI